MVFPNLVYLCLWHSCVAIRVPIVPCLHNPPVTSPYQSLPLQYLPYYLIYLISRSDYLVPNRVWAAQQQDSIVQGVKCILYKVWSVYCTSLPCRLYNVYRLYFTRCTECIIHVLFFNFTYKLGLKKEDFDIKSNVFLSKYFFRNILTLD